ncbi:RibD family protein [Nocardia sp. CDC160]|uniref:RibD family protein n=1 Tax=Nocardia sp. CDC160 TaxID=3112166 RepID=UPI002DBFCD8B|nr:dihydrofolate reductase family protein [Nocardia sp. CDC160]MEC3915589.1 dihydrofolate reductase family protein [Nocardia sp. CDC160]
MAVSLDGYIDDMVPERLYLSNDRDFDGVDALRAECDAILIGAETVRRDNPRLWLRSEERRAARATAGKPENLLKVTVTRSGDIDPAARMFHHHVEAGKPLVYTTFEGAAKIGDRLDTVAEVITVTDPDFWGALLDDLGRRGIARLIVEGGTHIHTAFLASGLADELRYAVAPLLIGQAEAPRFVGPAEFPGGSRRRLEFLDASVLDDVVVLRYRPKGTSATAPGS